MRVRGLTTELRVAIKNEMRVFLESLDFEIEMRDSQKSDHRDHIIFVDVERGSNLEL